MAQFHSERGEVSAATLSYEKVLAFEPNQTTALNDLGVIYLRTQQYIPAGRVLLRLYQQRKDPTVALNLGIAYYGQQRWSDALEYFEASHEMYAQTTAPKPSAATAAGDVHLELGNLDLAKTWYQRALEIFDTILTKPEPTLRVRGQRAVCLAKLGDLDRAQNAIDELMPEKDKEPYLLLCAARVSALRNDRARLFELAPEAIAAGVPPSGLLEDASFKHLRRDPEYLRILDTQ